MQRKDSSDIEYFVYLSDYQPGPFIEWANSPLEAIEKAINKNVVSFPGMFIPEKEIPEMEYRFHFRSLSGIFVRNKHFPMAEVAYWDS